MSVLIKGMDMPKNCSDCKLRAFTGIKDLCPVTGREMYGWDYSDNGAFPDDCPLNLVPPHGRLIDGDVAEVISFEEADAEGKDFADGVLYAADFISQMPTIIEAEEEKT